MSFALDAIKALCAGDMLSTLLLRVRPYEKVPGSANALYSYINRIGRRLFNPKLANDDLTERYDVMMPNSYFSKSIEEKKEILDCLSQIGVDFDNPPVITKYKEFVRFAVSKGRLRSGHHQDRSYFQEQGR